MVTCIPRANEFLSRLTVASTEARGVRRPSTRSGSNLRSPRHDEALIVSDWNTEREPSMSPRRAFIIGDVQ